DNNAFRRDNSERQHGSAFHRHSPGGGRSDRECARRQSRYDRARRSQSAGVAARAGARVAQEIQPRRAVTTAMAQEPDESKETAGASRRRTLTPEQRRFMGTARMKDEPVAP